MASPSELATANFKASHFFLLEAAAECPHCGARSRVFALALPPEHEWLQIDDDEESADAWQSANTPTVLFHVESLNRAAAVQLRNLAPGYRPGRACPSGVGGWVNHCDRCEGPLEDDDLHCEPEAAFMPISAQAARTIRLTEVRLALQANATDSAPEAEWLAHVTQG